MIAERRKFVLVESSPRWAHEVRDMWDDEHEKVPADAVVEWARTHPKSDLHRQFEWDDAVAGEKYRVEQARDLIQRVLVYVEKGEDQVVPLAIHMEDDGPGYALTLDVLDTRAEDVTREEARRLLGHVNRAMLFPGLQELKTLQKAREELRGLAE